MTWSELPRDPSSKMLRQFAGLWLAVFGTLGLLHGSTLLLAAALIVGLPGLAWPRLLRPLFVGWMMAVFPIGWLVSHVVLGLLFYGLFTPLGFLFRLRGRDALCLRRRGGETYWQLKPAAASAARYYKQF